MLRTEMIVLSRQRFFEVKKVMEDYNNDLIGFDDFRKLITHDEAEAYEFMLRLAGFNLTKVKFSEYFQ